MGPVDSPEQFAFTKDFSCWVPLLATPLSACSTLTYALLTAAQIFSMSGTYIPLLNFQINSKMAEAPSVFLEKSMLLETFKR